MNTNQRHRIVGRIQRIDHHLQILQTRSQRFSWLRVGIFSFGVLATWASARMWGPTGGWIAFLASTGLFSLTVFLHRRVELGISTFKAWRQIQSRQLARLELDWERLPCASLPADWLRSPLEIDLDLTGPRSLHHLLDVAVTRQGSYRLAEWLTRSTPDAAAIQARQQIVQELVEMQRFRERLQLTCLLTTEEALESNRLLRWLSQELPAGALNRTLGIAAFGVATNILLFTLYILGRVPPYWALTLAFYAMFYFTRQPLIRRLMDSIVELDSELDRLRAILVYLEKARLGKKPHLKRLLDIFTAPENRPLKQLRWVKLATTLVGLRMNYVTGVLLNLILPWDFICAKFALQTRRKVATSLPEWLERLHDLGALISLANFASLNPESSFAHIDPCARPVFVARRLGHPLIPVDRRVGNDFEIPETGMVAIITGSNMAGKSTFLKTVGINLLLAYAGGPVIGTSMISRPFSLHTCMRISDSIVDGYSYFYAEVRCLKNLLHRLETVEQMPTLYLIDEIFRGTNNRERLIGSQAYLRQVSGLNGAGLVATHDLELARLAQENPHIVNYHFRDVVHERRLIFDYRIQPGPCLTSNALKIMAMEGLPVEWEQAGLADGQRRQEE